MSKLMVAGPSHLLVITGWEIDEMKLAKKQWVHPGQKCIEVYFGNYDHTFIVRAISRDKISFVVPSTFTTGFLRLLKYVNYLSAHVSADCTAFHLVNSAVREVVEDQIRVVAASMTMEEIFKGIKQFKQLVFNLVQLQLDQFGLCIVDANIEQLQLDDHHFCSRCEIMGMLDNKQEMLKECNH